MEPAGILLLLTFPVGPLLLGLYAWRRHAGRQTNEVSRPVPLLPGVLNASFAMAFGFNLIYFVQEFFLAWPKSRLPGVEATVYHNNHSWSGEHADIILYQGAGALAIIVLGLLLTAGGWMLRRRLGGWAPLVWWTAAMALGLGLVQVPIAAMHPDNDVGQAFEFLALSSQIRVALAAICCALAIGFGLLLGRMLLGLAPASAVRTAWGRVRYLLTFSILPLLLGSLLAWANRAPPIGHLTMPLFSGLFVLPWALAAAALLTPPPPVSERLHGRLDWPLIAASLALLLFYRMVLAPGLSV